MNEQQKLQLQKLREKYLGSKDSQAVIDDLETRYSKVIEEKGLSQNPIFIAICSEAQKRIDDINTLLSNDEKLTDLERRTLFAKKEVWQFVSDSFGMKVHDNAIKMLDLYVEEKLAQ